MESSACFRFRASFAPCTIFQIIRHDLESLRLQLTEAVSKAPDFFRGAPVVIDLEKLPSVELPNFPLLKEMLVASGMVPVGVRNATPAQMAAAEQHGLPEFSFGKASAEPIKMDFPEKDIEQKKVKDSTQEITQENKAKLDDVSEAADFAEKNNSTNVSSVKNYPRTRLITTPIRSGMQVYAREADLVVLASVSPGAELLADGHIHVYGALRGRALAGVRGNKEARIFCSTLEAELISIAGYYLTKENMPELPAGHGMIQVFLHGEQVLIEPVIRTNSG